MLVNSNNTKTEHIEFVSYDGCFPNLCSGTLTLLIDGVEVKFGNKYVWDNSVNRYVTNGNQDSFWLTGGGCTSDYCAYQKEWKIDVDSLSEQYRKYAEEIDKVFNTNVPYGCCGGCI